MSGKVIGFPAKRLDQRRKAKKAQGERELLDLWDGIPADRRLMVWEYMQAVARFFSASTEAEFEREREITLAIISRLPFPDEAARAEIAEHIRARAFRQPQNVERLPTR